MSRIRRTRLVLATREFFPPTTKVEHERALYVLERIKSLMGIADWDTELAPVSGLEFSDRAASGWPAEPVECDEAAAAPTGDKRIVPYDPDVIDDARRLIAMQAQQLCRFLVASIPTPCPGGIELQDLASELAVAYVGFGIFGANATLSYERRHAVHHGYLSEETWAFALAVFVSLRDVEIPPGQLRISEADLTNRALHYLKRNAGLLAPLRGIA